MSFDPVKVLHTHLNAIVAVEFFTIPVYLTGVYSFRKSALAQPQFMDLQQRTLSVGVQEMYHLQIAGNLANAMGVSPQIPQLSLKAKGNQIPYLMGQDGNPTVFNMGNLQELIQTMVVIETPTSSFIVEPNAQADYDSIAKLYYATLVLMDMCIRENLINDNNINDSLQIAYGAFASRYKHNKLENWQQLCSGINAITDQGDGSDVADGYMEENPGTPVSQNLVGQTSEGDVHPEFQPKAGSRFYKYDDKTHLERFEKVENILKGYTPEQLAELFYCGTGTASIDLPEWIASENLTVEESQHCHNIIWSYMIDMLNKGFATGKLSGSYIPDGFDVSFSATMIAFKYTIPMIWKLGATPVFTYIADVSSEDVNTAFDRVDPLCLFHWDDKTAELRAGTAKNSSGQPITWQANGCMGLNSCAQQGWGQTGTQPGDSQCATADFHTCVGSNSCNYQGGCGFLAHDADGNLSPADIQFHPSSEYSTTGKGTSLGGCQTPIAPAQVFNSSTLKTIKSKKCKWSAADKAKIEKLINKPVWDQARTLLQAKSSGSNLPSPPNNTDYDGTARRAAVEPTSTISG